MEGIRLFSLQGRERCLDLIILIVFVFNIVIDTGDFLIQVRPVNMH